MNRVWKATKQKHKGPIEPDRSILEMAVARELLSTWETLGDRLMIDKHLASLEKVYGANAHLRVREYMREIKRNER